MLEVIREVTIYIFTNWPRIIRAWIEGDGKSVDYWLTNWGIKRLLKDNQRGKTISSWLSTCSGCTTAEGSFAPLESRIFGAKPLDIAAKYGHTEVVSLFWKTEQILRPQAGSPQQHHLIPQHIAHIQTFSAAWRRGANIKATRSSSGSAVLYWKGVVNLLLEKGVNIESLKPIGRAVLHSAALYLQTERAAAISEERKFKYTCGRQESGDSITFDSKQLIPTITILPAHGANILQKTTVVKPARFGKSPASVPKAKKRATQ
ncbi:hypothetical protein EV426DRAFT_643780 [Tirmania nivea]|nr:hypothetical protein EV426DRAFT_643780 [Tirmania nivea]